MSINPQMLSKESLYRELKSSGKLNEITKNLTEKLLASKWKDQVAKKCDESIDRVGVENTTAEKVAEDVTSFARENVPAEIKQHLMLQIKAFIEENSKQT